MSAWTHAAVPEWAERLGRMFGLAAAKHDWKRCRELVEIAHKESNVVQLPPDVQEWAVAELSLCVRTIGLLDKAGIVWVRDLVQLRPCDILANAYAGMAVLHEIQAALSLVGLRLSRDCKALAEEMSCADVRQSLVPEEGAKPMAEVYLEYPDPDASVVMTLYDIVRNGQVAARRVEFGKCIWLTIGMVESLMLGEPGAPDVIGQSAAEMVDSEFTAAMQQLGKVLVPMDTDLSSMPVLGATEAIPWATIIKILLAILAGL